MVEIGSSYLIRVKCFVWVTYMEAEMVGEK